MEQIRAIHGQLAVEAREQISESLFFCPTACRRSASPSQQGNRLPASYHSLQDLHSRNNDEDPPNNTNNNHHHHAKSSPTEGPRRAFDVSSLIGETAKVSTNGGTRSSSGDPSSPGRVASSASPSSEKVQLHPTSLSVGPPPPPPTHSTPPPPHPGSLYPYLLHPGLYQHLAAAAAAAAASSTSVGSSGPPGLMPTPPTVSGVSPAVAASGPLNPMLLNAQLALNPFLAASAYAANLNSLVSHAGRGLPYHHPPHPPPSSHSHRFSPYPMTSPPRTSSTSPGPISNSSGSAFHPLVPSSSFSSVSPSSSSLSLAAKNDCDPMRTSPDKRSLSSASPRSSASPDVKVDISAPSPKKAPSSQPNYDLRKMERLINGLNKSESDARGSSSKS